MTGILMTGILISTIVTAIFLSIIFLSKNVPIDEGGKMPVNCVIDFPRLSEDEMRDVDYLVMRDGQDLVSPSPFWRTRLQWGVKVP